LVPLTLARLGARARRRGRRLRGRRAHRAPALPLSAPVPLCTPPCFMWMHCARRTHGHASSPCMCDPSLVDRTSCTGTFCAGDCRRQPVCAQQRARARSSGGWSSAGPLGWAALRRHAQVIGGALIHCGAGARAGAIVERVLRAPVRGRFAGVQQRVERSAAGGGGAHELLAREAGQVCEPACAILL
jgi:hypothetical protein